MQRARSPIPTPLSAATPLCAATPHSHAPLFRHAPSHAPSHAPLFLHARALALAGTRRPCLCRSLWLRALPSCPALPFLPSCPALPCSSCSCPAFAHGAAVLLGSCPLDRVALGGTETWPNLGVTCAAAHRMRSEPRPDASCLVDAETVDAQAAEHIDELVVRCRYRAPAPTDDGDGDGDGCKAQFKIKERAYGSRLAPAPTLPRLSRRLTRIFIGPSWRVVLPGHTSATARTGRSCAPTARTDGRCWPCTWPTTSSTAPCIGARTAPPGTDRRWPPPASPSKAPRPRPVPIRICRCSSETRVSGPTWDMGQMHVSRHHGSGRGPRTHLLGRCSCQRHGGGCQGQRRGGCAQGERTRVLCNADADAEAHVIGAMRGRWCPGGARRPLCRRGRPPRRRCGPNSPRGRP